MMNAIRSIAAPRDGALARFASRILMLLLAAALVPVFAAAPPAGGAARGKPHLASMQIEIWPEFDRPASLIILKGELAKDIPLPAAVTLRIPAASGGPSAVAYAAGQNGGLLELKYDRSDAADYITLRFQVPERYFHVEYYDPLAVTAPERNVTYAWPGDFAVDRLSVVLQEPAMASGVTVQPPLEATASGKDGMRYRSAALGAFPAGKRLEVKIKYTKTDSRTSAQIVKPKSEEATPLPSAPPKGAAFEAGPTKTELAIWLIAGVAALGLGIWAVMMWWYGREKRATSQSEAARFCRKCGAPSLPDARFCSRCGTKLA